MKQTLCILTPLILVDFNFVILKWITSYYSYKSSSFFVFELKTLSGLNLTKWKFCTQNFSVSNQNNPLLSCNANLNQDGIMVVWKENFLNPTRIKHLITRFENFTSLARTQWSEQKTWLVVNLTLMPTANSKMRQMIVEPLEFKQIQLALGNHKWKYRWGKLESLHFGFVLKQEMLLIGRTSKYRIPCEVNKLGLDRNCWNNNGLSRIYLDLIGLNLAVP